MAELHVAVGWLAAGRADLAMARCRALLEQDPSNRAARRVLADAYRRQGRLETALEAYDILLQEQPDDEDTEVQRERCRQALVEPLPPSSFESHPDGRVCLHHQRRFPTHRSGWNHALESLRPVHRDDGVLLDGFLEDTFAWRVDTLEAEGVVPYARPWIGFVHNPADMPAWYHPHSHPAAYLSRASSRQSLEHCLGLFTLSEHLAAWVRQQTGKPVASLRLPTAEASACFSLERFMANPHKRVVQIGWWLRRLRSIYRLPLARDNRLGYVKVWLQTVPFWRAQDHFTALLAREPGEVPAKYEDNTRLVRHLGGQDYDRCLAENIAFMDLWDSSANTAITECMMRTTPLLVNPLPAVIEYLGAEYPFYYSTLEEAAEKALDVDLIGRTQVYLERCETWRRLSGQQFLEDFRRSAVYQALAP